MKIAFDWDKKILDPDFCSWAFGAETSARIFYDCVDLMHTWNALHGDELTLVEDGDMFYDLIEMEKLWNWHGAPSFKTLGSSL